ncbi:MAG: RluA family pseudouridine synthase [Anaeroplasma bactoclasticum]|nr:RluA family pseudouridine synthase [Anaeroplasma bactoclasticum]
MIKRFFIKESEILVKDYLTKQGIFQNAQKAIKQGNGQLLVNDQIVENWYVMHHGDILEVVFPASFQGEHILGIKGPLDILYEDSYLLILNKPNNLATIPTRLHYQHSLANYVMSYYKRKGIISNIHFIGRLDYATSGIVVLAKNPYIMAEMKKIALLKEYILEVEGHCQQQKGIIEVGIEKDPTSIIKRRVTTTFVNSKTTYEVLQIKESTSIVKATLHTGKTHQLRLHFAHLGHSIIGDELYGKKASDGILHLHSMHIRFVHPILQQEISITCLPQWIEKII